MGSFFRVLSSSKTASSLFLPLSLSLSPIILKQKIAFNMGQIAKVVEVRAEEAKLEVVKAEDKGKHVGDWGAKQRHTVTSSQPHETVGSAAAMQPHQRFGASKATSASNKPGKASSAVAQGKVHACVAPVKKEKDQTLTDLLTTRSKVLACS
jgi:hypothetical protein